MVRNLRIKWDLSESAPRLRKVAPWASRSPFYEKVAAVPVYHRSCKAVLACSWLHLVLRLPIPRLSLCRFVFPQTSSKQDPLIWVFGHFWLFSTIVYNVERHLLWKCHKQIQRKSWSNVPPKLLTCIWFLSKLYTKSAVSENSIVLGRLNLTFLSLGLSLWNLARLFIMFMATKYCLRFFNFCLGTWLWSFKFEKTG